MPIDPAAQAYAQNFEEARDSMVNKPLYTTQFQSVKNESASAALT